jgi:hypothetical protein
VSYYYGELTMVGFVIKCIPTLELDIVFIHDISRTPLGGGDSTDQTSQANLRKLNFNNTLYQLAYSQVLLQHLNKTVRVRLE